MRAIVWGFEAALCACVLVASACGGSGESSGAGGGGATAGTTASGGSGESSGSGGSGGSSGTGGAMTPDARFLNDYASAVCAMYEPCCDGEGLGFDQAGCTRWFSRVTDAYWNGDFQADAAAACLEKLAAARADDPARCSSVTIFETATFYAECQKAFAPSASEGAAPGEACEHASDCAVTAGDTVTCYDGHCLIQHPGAEGDGPCTVAGLTARPTELYACDAADGLSCERESNQCVPKAADGERCTTTDNCVAGAMCTGGLCHELPGEGEPCLNGVQGAGGYCAPGTACDRTTVVCGPGRGKGETCKEGECADGVCLDGLCKPSDFTKELNCTG